MSHPSVSEPTAPVSTTAWRNAVMVMFALGGITISAWGPRLASIRESLDVGDGVIGAALAGVAVGSVLGLVASSALLARLGPHRAIAGVLVTIALGMVVVATGAGFLSSLLVTIVGFLIVGFGIGALDIMVNVEGSAIETALRRTLMPLLHAAWSAGAILGSGIGAACAALNIDFEWQFIGEAIAIAVIGVVCVRFLPRTVPADEPVAKAPLGTRIREWARGWSDWRLLMIGLVMLGVELGEGTSNSWLTLAVRDGHHQPDAIAALFFTAFAIGETGARVLGSPLVDRFGRVTTVRVTTAIGVVGLLLFILGGPAWVVLVGTVFWAIGVSMGFPLGMSAAADSGPNPAARVSVVASIGYIANLGGPPVIGALSESVGLLNSLWLIVAFLVVGFIAAGALRARRGRVVAEPVAVD